jgi:hypothetical protein
VGGAERTDARLHASMPDGVQRAVLVYRGVGSSQREMGGRVQVQATMPEVCNGSMPHVTPRHRGWPETAAKRHASPIATSHSTSDDV